MSRKFSSTVSSAIHCQPKGLGRILALFAFEEMYRVVDDKSLSVGIFGALGCWLNPGQLIKAGGASVF
jgi:uridine phosphorylase